MVSPSPPATRGIRGITAEDRMELLGQLTPGQQTHALLWLAGYAPDVFDAVTEAVQPFPGDGSDDPAPFCELCGADIGVFLKLGLAWQPTGPRACTTSNCSTPATSRS